MVVRSVFLKSSAFNQMQLLQDPLPKILFFGRSNVGKSSMINCLLQRRNLARTSSRPGKTLSVNFFLVNDAFYFVDLPGYGYAHTSRAEKARVRQLMAAFFLGAANVRLACLLVDARRGLQDSDLDISGLMLEKKHPILTILTKGDKLSSSNLRNQISEFQKNLGIQVIPFSTKTKMGWTEIWELIEEAIKEC